MAKKANAKAAKSAEAPALEPLKRKAYEHELAKLHAELVALQLWVVEKQKKVCIVFEGRDGAGKGGVIKAITERVSPRVFRVVALPAPSDREKTQIYTQRYIRHFPAGGEIAMFDRSWYNRAGVKRVMGFCSEDETRRFLKMAPEFEKAMINSGVTLLKYWLEVGEDEQQRRLEARSEDPRKVWKLSPMDLRSFSRWDDYSRARDDMFAATNSDWAPWHVVRSNDKRRARLDLISHLLSQLPYETPKRAKIKLPKRDHSKRYDEPDYAYKFVPQRQWGEG